MWKLYRPCDRDMPGYMYQCSKRICMYLCADKCTVFILGWIWELSIWMSTIISWREVNKWMHFFDGTNDLMCSEMKSCKTQTTQCNSLFSLFRFWMLEEILFELHIFLEVFSLIVI